MRRGPLAAVGPAGVSAARLIVIGNRLIYCLILKWGRLKGVVAAAMLGLSGSLTAGTLQHAFLTCKGNCFHCGSCAVALGGAVAAGWAGVAGRTGGRRRWIGMGAVAAAGLVLFMLLYAWKSGLARAWPGA